MTQITLSIHKIILLLALIAFIFVPINYTLRIVEGSPDYQRIDPQGYFYLLDMDGETSIPTWFSTLQLATAAFLTAGIAYISQQKNRAYVWHWRILALLLFVLAADEYFSLHERLMTPVRELLQRVGLFNGYLYFAWVVPAIIFLIVFVAVYLRFLWHLPENIRLVFLVAGFVFVAGAVGLEMIGARFFYEGGITNRTFRMLQPIEEFCEMIGVTLFIYGLLIYSRGLTKGVQIQLL